MTESLLLVAIKTDQPNIANRLKIILAASQAFTPDSDAAAFAKPVGEITAAEYEALETLIGEKPAEGLRIGSLVGMDAIRA